MPNSVLRARDASTAPISHETPTFSLTLNMCWVLDRLLDDLGRTELMEKGKER